MSRSPVPSLRSAVTAALLLSLAACGAGDRAESRTDTAPVVRDSAGVRIVENTGPLWRAGEGWRIVSASTAAPAPTPAPDSVSAPVSAPTAPPVPAIDIGVFDGDPAYQLHRVVGALRLDDGRIVVLNDGSAEIRFYDDAGRHLRTVGGRGEGPGEFQWLGGVVRAGGDSLLVLDRRLPRVSVLDTDGGLLGTIPLSPPADTARFPGVRSLATYALAGRFSDGRLLLASSAFPVLRQPSPRVYWLSRPNLLYSPTGEPLDTIGPGAGVEFYGGTQLVTLYPFARWTRYDVHGDRLIIGDASAPEVRGYGADGTLETIIRYPREPTPITDALVDAAVERALEQRAGSPSFLPGGNDIGRWRAFYDAMPRPESLPAYAALEVDRAGNIWLQDWRPAGERGPRRWTVLTADGRLLGSLTLPDIDVHDVGDDYVLGVWKDDVDVEHVRLYRLDRAVP